MTHHKTIHSYYNMIPLKTTCTRLTYILFTKPKFPLHPHPTFCHRTLNTTDTQQPSILHQPPPYPQSHFYDPSCTSVIATSGNTWLERRRVPGLNLSSFLRMYGDGLLFNKFVRVGRRSNA